MIEEYYRYIQFIVVILLLVTGIYLLIGKVPKKPILNSYKRSRKIMGMAFFVFSLQFFLQWRLNARDAYPLVASALNISFFYLAAILLGFSFISLLNERYLKRSRVVTTITAWGIVSAAIWLSIFFMAETIIKWVLILSALWLLFYVVHLSWISFGTYRDAVNKIKNYYSEEADRFIRWISKSVFCTIVMGLLCPIMAFAPKWMITIYLLISVPFFYYIFVQFLNYMIDCETVDRAIDNSDDIILEEQIDSSSSLENLETKLQEWVLAKGYLQPKINLIELAKQVNSNRSYLSNYINSTYCCTFYEWIARLRIEESKEILLSEPTLTITQISEMVGFSSCSHFTIKFKEKEKVSPTTWRKNNV